MPCAGNLFMNATLKRSLIETTWKGWVSITKNKMWWKQLPIRRPNFRHVASISCRLANAWPTRVCTDCQGDQQPSTPVAANRVCDQSWACGKSQLYARLYIQLNTRKWQQFILAACWQLLVEYKARQTITNTRLLLKCSARHHGELIRSRPFLQAPNGQFLWPIWEDS